MIFTRIEDRNCTADLGITLQGIADGEDRTLRESVNNRLDRTCRADDVDAEDSSGTKRKAAAERTTAGCDGGDPEPATVHRSTSRVGPRLSSTFEYIVTLTSLNI